MTLIARAETIATNHDAGASELLAELLPLLSEAIAAGAHITRDVARVICTGQPAMAPLWNACAAAVADLSTPGRFARVRAEMERAPAALIRSAGAVLADAIWASGRSGPPTRATILTLSFSNSVAQTLSHLARDRSFEVVCGEGRPRYEGRRMAKILARAGSGVTLTTDAALTVYLPEATAVVVGADAIAADHWINKVGTLGLAAAAALRGVPVYVIATRDKALARPLAQRWTAASASADEVWDAPVEGVHPVNPYFEAIPVELATLFVTEAGPVSPTDIAAISERFLGDLDHFSI